MTTLILRVMLGHWGKGRSDPGRWSPAYAVALVDGFRVSCTGNGKGWACECPDPDCLHPDTFAALIHPNVLRVLEAEDDTEFRPPRPAPRHTTAPSSATPRSRSREDVAQ